MLDFDLAAIYGYSTRRFNEQVKRNIARFDEDFMFSLTKKEIENLKSQNATSSWGGARKLPNAFTEQGIYMLMTVLKGDLAIKQSKALIRLFNAMKIYISNNEYPLTEKRFSLTCFKRKFKDQISKSIVEDYRKEFPNKKISFINSKNTIHDRIIIMNYKTNNETMLIPGSSIKDTGNKYSTVIKVDSLKLSAKMNYLIFNEKEYLFK